LHFTSTGSPRCTSEHISSPVSSMARGPNLWPSVWRSGFTSPLPDLRPRCLIRFACRRTEGGDPVDVGPGGAQRGARQRGGQKVACGATRSSRSPASAKQAYHDRFKRSLEEPRTSPANSARYDVTTSWLTFRTTISPRCGSLCHATLS
jgi:hypothetical protein